MRDGDIVVIAAQQVARALAGRERELLETVKLAYLAHGAGASSLPHSVFLRFPNEPRNRIIGLPAYLGREFGVAGIKWVSSFPGNLDQGLERASAVIILNSPTTGRPEAIIEGSLISGMRTAASAALAAETLRGDSPYSSLGVIGSGYINFQTVRFTLEACPEIERILIHDIDATRAHLFREKCLSKFKRVEVEVAANSDDILRNCTLISLATTASKPHLFDLSGCRPGTTILHVSLRDLTPEVILSGDNVVDDVDHVCREQTSIHLAEQLVGNRDFIRCTLAEILSGRAVARRDPESIAIFSPFGLGVLDLAVARLVRDLELERGGGSVVKGFLPASWVEKA
jgi:ornithine cyclodeaminase